MKKDFCSIPEAITHIQQGHPLIIVDRQDRENEGDFFFPAELITPELVNFMITHGKGLLCVAITSHRAEALHLPPMVPAHNNTESTGVTFAVSVNASHGVHSGISAYDRAVTIKALAHEDATPEDFTRPGHIFPLIAKDGGVLVRDGHTEAAVDLSRLAGYYPAGVLCEIVHEDGHMATLPQLEELAERFGLKIVSIADLILYEQQNYEGYM